MKVISLDARRAVKQSGKTQRQFAQGAFISHETLRGMLYRGHLTSLPTAYHMTHEAGELTLDGPRGRVVMVAVGKRDDHRTPPPSAPAAAPIPTPLEEAA